VAKDQNDEGSVEIGSGSEKKSSTIDVFQQIQQAYAGVSSAVERLVANEEPGFGNHALLTRIAVNRPLFPNYLIPSFSKI
jgi:hypothetical protein